MKLYVGLTESKPGWTQILDQEKIPYQIYTVRDPSYDVNSTPVIVVTNPSLCESHPLLRFAKQGGMIIAEKKCSGLLRARISDRQIVQMDLDVDSMCLDWQSVDKKFTFNNVFVTEKVALVRKSEVRAKVFNAAREAFRRLSIPLVRLWYYPDPYETVFGFRFDLDEYDPNDFQVMCDLVRQYREAISCFVCMKSYEKLGGALKTLTALGVEIASHAYVHHVYNSYEQNKFNVLKAEELLKQHIPSVDGFAGPHGKWHPSLEQVLEEGRYLYSSEFGLDYDNYPFFPAYHGKLSRVLHIPTHPVCEGVFLERYPYDEKMFDQYFSAVIQHHVEKKIPIFIFGHPERRIGRYPNILHMIMQRINAYPKVWKTTFREFAAWWLRRHRQAAGFTFEDGKLRLIAQIDKDCLLEIITPNGSRVLFKPTQLLDGLKIQETAQRIVDHSENGFLVHESKVRHSFFKRLKLWVKDWLDWEIKTPLNLIDRSRMIGWIKFVFRCAHDSMTIRPTTYLE